MGKWQDAYVMKKIIFGVSMSILCSAFLVAAVTNSPSKDHNHLKPSASSQCPFVNPNTGLKCIGIVLPGTPKVGGTEYKCSNGHTWLGR
jgi:hypothetical protein